MPAAHSHAGRCLYLHIGSHKTGTTSIQHALKRNAVTLARHNLCLFSEAPSGGGGPQAPHLHAWLHFRDATHLLPRGMHLPEIERLCERLAALPGSVIISSENFSFFFEAEAIDQLQRHLSKIFDDIRIICYLRRQDRHIVSHHQEGSKLHRKAEYDLYGHAPLAIPPYTEAHRHYLDYQQRLGRWASAFGEDKLMLRVFDRRTMKGGDAVSDFFALLGIEDFIASDEEHNVSRGLRESKIGHLINQAPLRHKMALSQMVAQGLGEDGKMRPSRDEARRYYAHYAESNTALNRRYRISPLPTLFDEDFSDYPETAADRWNETEGNTAVLQLLHLLDGCCIRPSPDDLRDAALALSTTNLAAAVRLMRLAHQLRPSGSWIQRKLKELEAQLAASQRVP